MNNLVKTDLGIIQEVAVQKMQFLYMEVPNDTASQQKA